MTKHSYLFLSPIYIYIRVVNTVRAAVSRITNDKAICSLKKPQIYIYIRKDANAAQGTIKTAKTPLDLRILYKCNNTTVQRFMHRYAGF